jgi:hypothetical protein
MVGVGLTEEELDVVVASSLSFEGEWEMGR